MVPGSSLCLSPSPRRLTHVPWDVEGVQVAWPSGCRASWPRRASPPSCPRVPGRPALRRITGRAAPADGCRGDRAGFVDKNVLWKHEDGMTGRARRALFGGPPPSSRLRLTTTHSTKRPWALSPLYRGAD